MEKIKNEKVFNNEVDVKSLAFGVSLKYCGAVVRRLLEKWGGYRSEDIYFVYIKKEINSCKTNSRIKTKLKKNWNM